ncbi:hypothetical protein [Sphingobacterium hungaricum]
MKNFTIAILSFLLLLTAFTAQAQQENCESISEISLDRLTPLLDKNDFSQVDVLLTTIESVCGVSEVTQRIRILRLIIDKQPADVAIDDYINNQFDVKFTVRLDNADDKNFKTIYESDKAAFNFIPLGHPIDILTKQKATALLNSNSYNLNPKEELICLLFADMVEDFYNELDKRQAQVQPQTMPDEMVTITRPARVKKTQSNPIQHAKDRGGIVLSAGAYMPLGATNPVFKNNAVLGVSLMSPLSNSFIFEGMIKVRINSNDRDFDYMLRDEIYTINSKATYLMGGSIGYKVYDDEKYIIYPKIGIAFESTNTGLAETIYDDNSYDEYGDPTSYTRYNNLNTVNFAPGVTFMRYIAGKTFMGLNVNYHYSPYHLNNNLQTEIFNSYSSVELFVRFSL